MTNFSVVNSTDLSNAVSQIITAQPTGSAIGIAVSNAIVNLSTTDDVVNGIGSIQSQLSQTESDIETSFGD